MCLFPFSTVHLRRDSAGAECRRYLRYSVQVLAYELRHTLSFRCKREISSPSFHSLLALDRTDATPVVEILSGYYFTTRLKLTPSDPEGVYVSSDRLFESLPPNHLLLDSAPNIGTLLSRWELDKFNNC
jgi:hypothetical protein